MSHINRFLFVAALTVFAACSGNDIPDSLATADTSDTETTELEAPAHSEQTETPELVETSVAPAPVETSVAPAPVTTSVDPIPVDTTVPPTIVPDSTTIAPTTTIAGPPTCSGPRYEVEIPAGWAVEDCRRFTSGVFPSPTADLEFRPEIELAFATSETFTESLTRIRNTETVLSSIPTVVDGLPAQRIVVVDNAWFIDGVRTSVVVDAGDGVFFASVAEVIDIQGRLQGGDFASHYAFSVEAFDEMLSTVSISEGAPATCQAPTLSNPTVLQTGTDDIDGDGDLETLSFIDGDDQTVVAIEGLENGIVWSRIANWNGVGTPALGWHDWDQDGNPEIFTSGDGGASSILIEVRSVDGCGLTRVFDQDGQPVTLRQQGSGLSASNYQCNYDEAGGLASLEVTLTRFDANDGTAMVETTPFVYADRVLTSAGTNASVGTAANPNPNASGFSACVIAIS